MSDAKHTAEQVAALKDRCERLQHQLDFLRRERGGEPLKHREHHQPEPWPHINDLPVNSNIPWAYTHISECCGNVLMQMMDYVRAWACVNACRGMADPAAEIAALRAEVELLRGYVGENVRSDFKNPAAMRAELERLRAENAALRRNEAEALDAIKSVGYTTPHGESDSLGEAVAWLVKAVEAGDRMADNLTALASDIERGDALAVRAFVRDYRKERAS